MSKYNDEFYYEAREKVNDFMKKHGPIDEIITLFGTVEDLHINLRSINHLMDAEITPEEWMDIARIEIDAKRRYLKKIKEQNDGGTLLGGNEFSDFKIPIGPKNTWSLFKRYTLDKKLKFSKELINTIENDTFNIARSMSSKLLNDKPIKGIVIGGVQSGKTTNMASLMAMTSDVYNLYIVLSGTIDNLRIQTENRLRDMLDDTNKTKDWVLVQRPENKRGNRLRDFYKENRNLYMVVLKNSKRLRDLIDWLTADEEYLSKLRIVVIDDEADQASVNTSKDPDNDRKTINRLISNLILGKDKFGKKVGKFEAINYIGYTATPYANILSESPSEESLYPENFMLILSKNIKHFGPEQIFGLNKEEKNGLDIVRHIEEQENQDFIDQEMNELPSDLKDSIAYFLAASSSLRLHKKNGPVSMMIHMSNRQDVHNLVHEKVENWLSNNIYDVINRAKKIWTREINRFDLEDLKQKMYINESMTYKPHSFEEIEETIVNIVKNMSRIIREDNNNYTYNKGLMIVVDHSGDADFEVDEVQRLAYPEEDEVNKYTPIFLVIGGTTLSRGITLEGLISSYFLRRPSAADTLTQMGRWFGYRINYELYPRIWMTANTHDQFRFISNLENELYEEIKSLNAQGVEYNKIGPKIKFSPYNISSTARNKRYAEEMAEYDFTGFNTQTYKFELNEEIQKQNIEITESFINNLGLPNIIDKNRVSNIYWDNVPFEKIKTQLLDEFSFNNRIKSLGNITELISWIEKVSNENKLDNWNVILGTIGRINQSDNNWKLKHFTANMVTRSREDIGIPDEIDIRILRAPSDLYADIDFDKVKDQEVLDIINSDINLGKNETYDLIRSKLNMNRIPQLIIYKIDKDSSPRPSNKRKTNKIKLGINTDLMGLFIQIPRGDKEEDYKASVTVKIKDKIDVLDDCDLYEEE